MTNLILDAQCIGKFENTHIKFRTKFSVFYALPCPHHGGYPGNRNVRYASHSMADA